MSHFLVLVVGEDLKDQLLPFHEFECTGIDEYVQNIDRTAEILEDYESSEIEKYQAPDGTIYDLYDDFFYRDATEEEVRMIKEKKLSNWKTINDENFKIMDVPEDFIRKTFKEKDLMTFKEFYENDYNGEFILEDEEPDLDGKHKFGYGVLNKQGELIKIIERTNPDKKWDWYQIGGRWSGELKLKKNCVGSMGGKSWINAGQEDRPGYCDSAFKRDIDIDGMEEPMRLKAEKTYDSWHDGVKNLPDDSEEKQDWKVKNIGLFVPKSEIDLLNTQTREEYVTCKSCYAPFAVLWDGEWYQEGDMGWWGIVSDGDSNWKGQFKQLWSEIPDDELITAVDCHI